MCVGARTWRHAALACGQRRTIWFDVSTFLAWGMCNLVTAARLGPIGLPHVDTRQPVDVHLPGLGAYSQHFGRSRTCFVTSTGMFAFICARVCSLVVYTGLFSAFCVHRSQTISNNPRVGTLSSQGPRCNHAGHESQR